MDIVLDMQKTGRMGHPSGADLCRYLHKKRIQLPSYLTGLVNGQAQILDGHNYNTHTSLNVGFGLANADQVTTVNIGLSSNFTVGGFRESFHLISRWESYATMSSRWVSYDSG